MTISQKEEDWEAVSLDSIPVMMTNLEHTIQIKSLKHVRTENKDDTTLTTAEDHHGFMTGRQP